MDPATIHCDRCKKQIVTEPGSCDTGYGTTPDGQKHCYACCARMDEEHMRTHGKTMLYLSNGMVTNWPNSLRIKPARIWTGRHNFAGKVTYVNFAFEGFWWLGKCVGSDTQILHCKRTKETVSGWVECKFCHKAEDDRQAHRHAGGYVCAGCWDDRLKVTE